MIILIDNREQNPFFYDKAGHPDYKGITLKNTTLKTGDYSIKGMSMPGSGPSITIERKNPGDLFQSMGKGRERFEREIIRMSRFSFAALVTEIDFRDMFTKPPELTNMKPKAVFRSMLAFSARWNIHVFPCPGRGFAEKTALILLQRFWEDNGPGGKYDLTNV